MVLTYLRKRNLLKNLGPVAQKTLEVENGPHPFQKSQLIKENARMVQKAKLQLQLMTTRNMNL